MTNFEKNIDRLLPIMGDCGLYKIRMENRLHIGEGCSRSCKGCQQESKKWLLAEAEES
ncbi:MAG: hypothetical protein UDB11_03420 [Peptococcaceae bacterium]|nr:hypothetical protein [Peptococcaceae bacterium]